jgi:hypothetical protein
MYPIHRAPAIHNIVFLTAGGVWHLLSLGNYNNMCSSIFVEQCNGCCCHSQPASPAGRELPLPEVNSHRVNRTVLPGMPRD